MPLTGSGVVHRIITDLAVIDVDRDGLTLRELAPGLSAKDVQDQTEPLLRVAANLREMACCKSVDVPCASRLWPVLERTLT